MPEVLSRREWAISHGFIFLGLICLSIAIWLLYRQPVSNLLIFGLWFLSGGVCWTTAFLARRLRHRTSGWSWAADRADIALERSGCGP